MLSFAPRTALALVGFVALPLFVQAQAPASVPGAKPVPPSAAVQAPAHSAIKPASPAKAVAPTAVAAPLAKAAVAAPVAAAPAAKACAGHKGVETWQ